MLRALIRRLRGSRDEAQLALTLDAPPPRSPEELLERLRAHGLKHIDTIVLTNNRRTVVRVMGRELRLQRGYLDAPDHVHAAIASFVMATRRRPEQRRAALRTLLDWASRFPAAPSRPRAERTNPDDAPLAARLAAEHARLNDALFGGGLSTVPIRVSRRMKSRLGHYTPIRDGVKPEIAISRGHFRRHGWAEVVQTLLHEMVHQWQDESGLPVDHGAAFRRKARGVGAPASATRALR
ncbi:MAG: SprT-like domain-containing protein [Gemmatimonadetes bacterium]|nr:SprT-like domain-containing protein [Gemmatimonadota bacterium]MBI3567686.1 SprT-like domain-containing protein [Gemmatimonadota bacterium]